MIYIELYYNASNNFLKDEFQNIAGVVEYTPQLLHIVGGVVKYIPQLLENIAGVVEYTPQLL